VLYVEQLSNQGVVANKMQYSFGLAGSSAAGVPGVFQVISTNVFLDTQPILDPITGMVVSDMSNATAVPLIAGTDYTVDDSTAGLEVIAMTPSVATQPNTAFYVVHVTLVPTGTPTGQLYNTRFTWNSVGARDGASYQTSSSVPTTVVP
jgi:hypothetical protein